MSELTIIKNDIETSISDFNQPFTKYLTNLGLPIDGVLSSIEERKIVIDNIEREINEISIENRQKAVYLTRFLASVTSGLFDGAVTYLWNETIKSLRLMIVSFDLDYFYKICEQLNNRYKNMKTDEELATVGDFDLLTACNRMGLISDHVFEVFKFINYMRNHSSAAHPTENEIGAYDLLSWLNSCIKYAINATPNQQATKLKLLLYNIRVTEIPESDLHYIGNSIKDLPKIMVEDLLSTLFGMFTDPQTNQTVSNNIKSIAKYVWNLSSENKKYSIGDKYGYFRAHGEVARKDKANEFLILVNGLSYKDESSISEELRVTLKSLLSTHNSVNNFYNEEPWAKQLYNILPNSGKVPNSVLEDWVRTIVICYTGNGLGYREGVDEGAERYYIEFIRNFDNKAISTLLNLMDDAILLMDIDMPKATKRYKLMCSDLQKRCKNDFLNNALEYIVNCDECLSNVHKTTAYKELLEKVNLL